MLGRWFIGQCVCCTSITAWFCIRSICINARLCGMHYISVISVLEGEDIGRPWSLLISQSSRNGTPVVFTHTHTRMNTNTNMHTYIYYSLKCNFTYTLNLLFIYLLSLTIMKNRMHGSKITIWNRVFIQVTNIFCAACIFLTTKTLYLLLKYC